MTRLLCGTNVINHDAIYQVPVIHIPLVCYLDDVRKSNVLLLYA